jgi:hypothetical protein
MLASTQLPSALLANHLDLSLPIKEASKGFDFANSFLEFATASAAPGLGDLAAFFIRWAVVNAKFLYRSVFFIAMAAALRLQ